jgi:hypothetical protein
MQMNNEPVYITRDGTRIPYLPETVVTARDAYSATLHVMFRHLADFHLCVVSTISKKYGIPEDEIMNTIHESEEFKKLTPDAAITDIYGNDTTDMPDTTDTTDTTTRAVASTGSVREKKTPKKLVLKKKPGPDDMAASESAKELKKKPRQSKKTVEIPPAVEPEPEPEPAKQEPEPEPAKQNKEKEEPVVKKGQQKLTFKKMNSSSVSVSTGIGTIPSS